MVYFYHDLSRSCYKSRDRLFCWFKRKFFNYGI